MDFCYFVLSLVTCFTLVISSSTVDETNCIELSVSNYAYTSFFDLNLIKGCQTEDYFVKLPVSFDSDHGDIHVVFSESKETTNSNRNRVYEFLLGGYGNTLCEIRRKDYLHEKRNFNGNRFADVSLPTYRKFSVEFSISKNGVVQLEMDTQFRFNLTDQIPVIPVKYVSFAGYRGAHSRVKFDCVAAPENISTTTNGIASEAPTTDTLLDSSTDDALNEIVPRLSKEESINSNTVAP